MADTGYGKMPTTNPNPNNRTEQEYRALIRHWKELLQDEYFNPQLGVSQVNLKKVIDEMEKEVP